MLINGFDDAFDAIHLNDFFARMQRNVVVFVPVPDVQNGLVQSLLARQNRAEQNAVVVGVWLRAKNSDLVQIRRNFEQLFNRAPPPMPLPTITSFDFSSLFSRIPTCCELQKNSIKKLWC